MIVGSTQETRRGEPLVSVVIPTYNRAHHVARAVSSALSQTHRNLEIVVVDDASTDETHSVLASITDSRLQVIRSRARQGAAHARNLGIRSASARFVAFLDSDDEWLPAKVERQVAAFSVAEAPAVVYTGMWIDRGGKRTYDVADPEGMAFERLLMFAGPITTSGIMIDRDLVGDELYFDESVTSFEEGELLLRISRGARIGRVPEPLYVFHHHSGDRVSEPGRQVLARRRLIELFAADLAQRPSTAAHHFFRLAIAQQRLGDIVGVRESLLAAASSDPSSRRLKVLAAAARLSSRAASTCLSGYRALGRIRRMLRWPSKGTELLGIGRGEADA
jgi:glycosyltransferase involved in cell wall biosynthesis